MTKSATELTTEDQHPHPLIMSRMSAIGDTIITARAQALASAKGYAPILLTHKSNAALLDCMPHLRGACLWSDGRFEFFLRESVHSALVPTESQRFFQWIHSGLGGIQNGRCTILDLQSTGRSKRAIKDLRFAFSDAGIAVAVQSAKKSTIWRIILIIWAHLTLRQWHGRTPPAWLQRRLMSVHEHQARLVAKLPIQPNREHHSTVVQQTLTAPAFRPDSLGDRYVLFAVGASARLKSWPREHYRALLKLILAESDAQVCLCGGTADAAVGEYLTFGQDSRVVNMIGQTNLAQTLGLIRGATYVVTGDSFASHVCDLMNVPASVIFGSTHPKLGFAPQGSHTLVHHSALSCSPCSRHGQGECRFKNVRCLTLVKPEQVFAQLKFKLGPERH